jgi:hypothetical protein
VELRFWDFGGAQFCRLGNREKPPRLLRHILRFEGQNAYVWKENLLIVPSHNHGGHYVRLQLQ